MRITRPTPREKEAIAKRRLEVARMRMLKLTQVEIAAALRVNQSTVSKDLKFLMREWKKSALADVAALRGEELMELRDMERTCALNFGTTADPRWIVMRLKLKERIHKLLGLDNAGAGQVSLTMDADRPQEFHIMFGRPGVSPEAVGDAAPYEGEESETEGV